VDSKYVLIESSALSQSESRVRRNINSMIGSTNRIVLCHGEDDNRFLKYIGKFLPVNMKHLRKESFSIRQIKK
jgi:hypothetical protein